MKIIRKDVMTKPSTPKAMVFDLDGTLVDTVETRIAAWLRTFEEHGIPAGREQVARLIGSDGPRAARPGAGAAGTCHSVAPRRMPT